MELDFLNDANSAYSYSDNALSNNRINQKQRNNDSVDDLDAGSDSDGDFAARNNLLSNNNNIEHK